MAGMRDYTSTGGRDMELVEYIEEHGLSGFYAGIQHALAAGHTVNKYADPIEGPACGLSEDEALVVAIEDVTLLWLDLDGGETC